MRLNKYIASCGAASRRGADALVEAGRVTVNGNAVLSHGMEIDGQTDVVCVDGRRIEPEEKKVYIMLNKPAGVVCTCRDDKGRKTVLDLIGGTDERLFPVGRLDYESEGLLLLTNDGDFAYRLTHPKHEQNKTYVAKVAGELTDDAVSRLRQGVVIDGLMTGKAQITVRERACGYSTLTVTIHEGRNRQIRRMMEAVGCRVVHLKRTAIGELTLGSLKTGQWRYLTGKDFSLLGIILF